MNSLEESSIKFIVSDHPVTIYNHAVSSSHNDSTYPNDPSITLKSSQTIFPLNRDFCLILTNLEYAKDPSVDPLSKRTFARNYKNSMARTDAFIRTRKFTSEEVLHVNYVLKSRARRYIAASQLEWLYPENSISPSWDELKITFMPPENELFGFGGEMFAKFESGHVHYQDEFGRTEEERDFLKKTPSDKPLRPRALCGCGSGRTYKSCCQMKAIKLRPTWSELSIRERNILLLNGIVNVLALDDKKDWVSVRQNLTDDQISTIYRIYEALWPRETDILSLLPKPDGRARAVYSGILHPELITDFALGSSIYFDELLIEHPFLHAGAMKKEFSPVDNPKIYRQEFLKNILFFITIMPLVENGLINLVPDPCTFDNHLHDQMLHMAKTRTDAFKFNPEEDPRFVELVKQFTTRNTMLLPRSALRAKILKTSTNLDEIQIEKALDHMQLLRERDPLAVLQENTLDRDTGGQMNMMKLSPNFEMAMYLAQATGAFLITDSPHRWREIRAAISHSKFNSSNVLDALVSRIEITTFAFPQDASDIQALTSGNTFTSYPSLMKNIFKYLSNIDDKAPKPKLEASLVAQFRRIHSFTQKTIKKNCIHTKESGMSCIFSSAGIQDYTVNRLLLMSGSETHLKSVPAAFFIDPKSPANE